LGGDLGRGDGRDHHSQGHTHDANDDVRDLHTLLLRFKKSVFVRTHPLSPHIIVAIGVLVEVFNANRILDPIRER
jgi:hypothetical protein